VRVPVWAHDLAQEFWRAAGAEEPFPRRLADALEATNRASVKYLSRLTLRSAQQWLAPLGIDVDELPERPLCGCFAASAGAALVLIDADDPPDEQRYTLAHETAHFLRDVWQPRRRAAAAAGQGVLDVVDGRRAASTDERLAAALHGIPLQPYVHLLPRDAAGEPATPAGAAAEDAADVLALELPAPAVHLAEAGAADWTTQELMARLVEHYGLPRRQAEHYAARLRPAPARPARWLQGLRAGGGAGDAR
jgi:hypothetical protein